MIARGSILSGPVVLGSDPEAVRPFTGLFITNRALIWYKMVCNLPGIRCVGVSEASQEALWWENGIQDLIQTLLGSKQHRPHGE